jgi:hypothetical protein
LTGTLSGFAQCAKADSEELMRNRTFDTIATILGGASVFPMALFGAGLLHGVDHRVTQPAFWHTLVWVGLVANILVFSAVGFGLAATRRTRRW